MNRLTIQEEEVMQAIWQCGGGVVKDFIAKLPSYQDVPYTTVASIVKNIEKKGYVEGKKFGNTIIYSPTIELSHYKRHFMGSVVKDYFTDSYRDVVAFFVQEKKITREELAELIELIEREEE